jgi:hypothetical protein
MRPAKELYRQTSASAAVVFSEIWPIIVRHKKTAIVIFFIELWIHGLVFEHLRELKELINIFPILGSLFN